MKASLASLSKIRDLQSCGSFLLDLKADEEKFCAVGNSLYEFQADSAVKEAYDGECEVCCENFSKEEVKHQAVLMCNNGKVCRACILHQIGIDLNEGKEELKCVADCQKPYLPSRAKLLMGNCCILCLRKQVAEVSSQFVEGPVDSFENSCGHRFCTECIKDYLVNSWKSSVAKIKCPGFKCSAVIDLKTQKKFLSQESTNLMRAIKLFTALQKYCRQTLSHQLNPWIWISPCCQKNIELPLDWVIRSWCPSIRIEVSEEVLKCPDCATIWYGILLICINSF